MKNQSQLENAQMGAETLDVFFQQFGAIDEQGKIVLDYMFELLYNSKGVTNEENLPVPSQTE